MAGIVGGDIMQKWTFGAAAVAAAFAFGADQAHAQKFTDKLYIKGGIGYHIPGDIESDAQGARNAQTVEFDDGFIGYAAVGYEFTRILSVEAEIGYHSVDVSDLEFGNFTGQNVEGEETVFTFMANVIAQFGKKKIKPYIGVGIGGANYELDSLEATNFQPPDEADETVFAYQFIAGVGYQVTPKIQVGVDYRYRGLGDITLDDGIQALDDSEIGGSHSILASLKYSF